MKITNTTESDPLLNLMAGLPGGIEAQEARGQRELVASQMLPTKGSENPGLVALGFIFGEIDSADPLFRPASLPEGWKKTGSSHDMWSHIVDERGINRVDIFYKAAFYDRSAFMNLLSVADQASGNFAYGGTSIPWGALTDLERSETIECLRGYLSKDVEDSKVRGYRRDEEVILRITEELSRVTNSSEKA